jgi:hypothetical protein
MKTTRKAQLPQICDLLFSHSSEPKSMYRKSPVDWSAKVPLETGDVGS